MFDIKTREVRGSEGQPIGRGGAPLRAAERDRLRGVAAADGEQLGWIMRELENIRDVSSTRRESAAGGVQLRAV